MKIHLLIVCICCITIYGCRRKGSETVSPASQTPLLKKLFTQQKYFAHIESDSYSSYPPNSTYDIFDDSASIGIPNDSTVIISVPGFRDIVYLNTKATNTGSLFTLYGTMDTSPTNFVTTRMSIDSATGNVDFHKSTNIGLSYQAHVTIDFNTH